MSLLFGQYLWDTLYNIIYLTLPRGNAQRCPEEIPGGNAWRKCPEEMPRENARRKCTEDMPGGNAQRKCPEEMPGGNARRKCPEMPGGGARRKCPEKMPGENARRCLEEMPGGNARRFFFISLGAPPGMPGGKSICQPSCEILISFPDNHGQVSRPGPIDFLPLQV